MSAGLETQQDRERIGHQRETVKEFMLWANDLKLWLTLEMAQRGIADRCKVFVPLPSLSARLRDLRKPEFGGCRVERYNEGGGLFSYRVFPPEPAPQAQLSLEETKR